MPATLQSTERSRESEKLKLPDFSVKNLLRRNKKIKFQGEAKTELNLFFWSTLS